MCLQLKKPEASYLGVRNKVANIHLKSKGFQNKNPVRCDILHALKYF